MSRQKERRIISFNEPYVVGSEQKYIRQVFENGFFAGNGPFTQKVQRLLEERFSIPHALLTHSCTAALEMSALLLDLKPGEQVLLPSYTFASTASAFLRTGAELVFCEISPETMNIDPEDVRMRITGKTRSIVPVHYGGIAADMHTLLSLAKEHGLVVIEDAAQALGAKIDETWLGGIAPLGAISFHETKNIHCGLGGALFINDASYFERAEDIWERGTNRAKLFKGVVDKYSWVELGSNFYPSELQAAFLLAQLESIDQNLKERQNIYRRYQMQLQPLADEGFFKLPVVATTARINFHSFYLICNSTRDCDELRISLSNHGIQAYIGYVPLHSSRMGKRLGYRPDDLPITEEYSQRVLRLPFHNALANDDIDRVTQSIRDFFT